MQTMEIKVKGMVCNGCENRVQNVLKTVPQVESVHADYQQEKVVIFLKENIDKNLIINKIETLGFEVGEITVK